MAEELREWSREDVFETAHLLERMGPQFYVERKRCVRAEFGDILVQVSLLEVDEGINDHSKYKGLVQVGDKEYWTDKKEYKDVLLEMVRTLQDKVQSRYAKEAGYCLHANVDYF